MLFKKCLDWLPVPDNSELKGVGGGFNAGNLTFPFEQHNPFVSLTNLYALQCLQIMLMDPITTDLLVA